jgi:hypothetical protein
MATAVFHCGGTDPADFSAADNWTGGGGTGGVPAASDTVLIRSIPKDVITSPDAFSAIAIVSLIVTNECRKSLGNSTTPIRFANITSLVYAGGGEIARLGSSGTVASADIAPTGGTCLLFNGTWTTVNSLYGVVEVGASAVVTNAYNIAAVWADEPGTAYTTFTHGGGRSTLKRSAGTVHANQGRLETEGAAAVTTKATIWGGATYNHRSSGTITLYEAMPNSTFSVRGNPYSGFTITNHTVWAGALIFDEQAGLTVTKTNPRTVKGTVMTGGDGFIP